MEPAPARNYDLKCRFYLPPGQGYSECEAGVNYDELKTNLGIKPLEMVRICMGRVQGCSRFQPYTREEIEADDKAETERLEREEKAVCAIREKTNGKRGQSGKMNCPSCPVGTLFYSTAEHNGHIAVHCSTPDCVDFRE
jgi:hypothetical protein